MSELIGFNTESGSVRPYSDLHAAEISTVADVLAAHEQSRQSGAKNPMGVIVFACIGDGPMSQFKAFATPDSSDPIKAALEAAGNAGKSSKTTIAISVSGSPEGAEIAKDDNIISFIAQAGRAVLFIGTDRSVVVASYEPGYA